MPAGVCLSPDRALDYVAGRLAADARRAAHAHLDRCELCREWVAGLARDSVAAFAPGDPAAPRAGIEVGRYRIRELVGMGGMGMVYRAFDPVLDRDVALKLVAETSPAARERLLAEARATARIAHPNVIAIHDAGAVGDEVYVAMELVHGVTLAQWLATGPALADLLAVFEQAAAGLQAAHDAGLVHRDFKPANVLIGLDARVRVADFGLAIAATGAAAPPGGTPAYMAPEQHAGGAVDAGADQFAFAAALYEAIAGVLPFAGATRREIERQIRDRRLSPPRRAVERGAVSALARALDPDPAARWPSVRALVGAVARAMRGDGGGARSPTRAPGLRAASAAAFLGVATVTALAFALSSGGAREPGTARARRAAATDAADPRPRIDRIARITDDPGCEENPTFSADGTGIVFDTPVDGDFEVMSLDPATGARRRLTRSIGWDLAARPSPDGARFAHVHAVDTNRQLWVSPIEPGAAAPIELGTFRGRPSWVDPGTLLVGTDQGTLELIDVASGARRPFGHGRHGLVDGSARVAGGEWAHVVREGTASRLVVGGKLAPVGSWRPLVDGALAAGADGRGLYYVGSGPGDALAIVRRDVASGRELALATPPPGHGLDVSRDGTRLVFSSCAARSHISRVRTGQEAPVALWPRRTWNESRPAVLSGRELAIMSSRHARIEVWRVDIATGDGRAVSIDDGRQPAVSPDGRWLAYASLLPGAQGIHVVELATGRARRLTRGADDRWPGFSADGRSIAFVRGIGVDGGIFRVAVDGGAEPVLVSPGWALRLATSPIDARIAVVLSDGSRFRVAVVEVDGQLRDVALPPDIYTSVAFSADGTRLLLARRFRDVVEIGLAPGARPVTRWSSPDWHHGSERIEDAIYAPDGDGYLVTHGTADGDLFLAEGWFS